MATSYTTNLGLALPVTGELAGQWGTVVNQEITELLDNAIAGTTTLSSDADVTLTDTDGAANQSRQAILLWTANGTVTRTITAPARTKAYIVINATAGTQSIKLVGAGPTTGVTIAAGEKCVAAWNGSDFVKVASSVADGVTTISFGTTGLTPSTGTSGDVTVAGTLAVANGGTGATSAANARTNLGATTVGSSYFTLTNPSAITFPRMNADNTVSALSASDFRTAIGAGTGGGDVTGPGSSTSGNIATFNGTTGKVIQDGGKALPSGNVVGTSDSQTLTNKTIEAGTFTNGYTEETVTANTGTAYTIDLANGSVQILTLTGNCTFTFPTATAGKSFMLLLKQDATGSRTVTWPAAVKWPGGTAPTITATASKLDKYVFTADGTNWYGSNAGQAYTV